MCVCVTLLACLPSYVYHSAGINTVEVQNRIGEPAPESLFVRVCVFASVHVRVCVCVSI